MQKRRYPLLSERFEKEALATLEIAERFGREYVMLPNGDIVPRARATIPTVSLSVSEPDSPARALEPGISVSCSTGQPEGVGATGTDGMNAPKAADGDGGRGQFLAVRTLAGLVAAGLLISSSVLTLVGGEASDAHLSATIGGLALGAVAVWAHNLVVRLESSTRPN